jgi:hypothetical protein
MAPGFLEAPKFHNVKENAFWVIFKSPPHHHHHQKNSFQEFKKKIPN